MDTGYDKNKIRKMKEYQKHLDFYNQKYWFSTSSSLIPFEEWSDKDKGQKYLEKYWLSNEEYLSTWRNIQQNIFITNKSLPHLIYKDNFNIIALQGGCLFLEKDFLQLQKILLNIGEKYFVVIQNNQEFTKGEPMFKMKFPVNITWKEMISGGAISAVLINMFYNEYYIFGESGKWGKYIASDYDYPIDLFGFTQELTPIFEKFLSQTKDEQIELWKWLPKEYKNRVFKNKPIYL